MKYIVLYIIILYSFSIHISAQTADSTKIALETSLMSMDYRELASHSLTAAPPMHVRRLCRDALLIYDLPQEADTLLFLCDTFEQIGTGIRYVDIYTERGGYQSIEVSVRDIQVYRSPIREEWGKRRLSFLLDRVRRNDYDYLSDDSSYVSPYADHWTRLHFLLFIKHNGYYVLRYYKKMGQEIKQLYQEEHEDYNLSLIR